MVLVDCFFAGAAVAATNMTPVAVTGFNRDLVIENNASGPSYSSYAVEFNPGEGTAFYQSGLPGKSYGLPASGSFTSALGDGTVFLFQPYTGNNALVLSSATGLTSGNLTLLAPDALRRIAISANSASASSTSVGTLTLHFSDGSTLVTNYNAQDWFFNPGFALQGVDRINISSGATDGGPNGDPRFYQTTIDLTAALGTNNKPLASLTFGKASSANATAIYAVSGLPTSAIAPPAVTNVPAIRHPGEGGCHRWPSHRDRRRSSDRHGFFGAWDGGTDASLWAQTIALGLQGGGFVQTISGLTPNAVYYYTSRAVNSAGTNWATPSATFQTPR